MAPAIPHADRNETRKAAALPPVEQVNRRPRLHLWWTAAACAILTASIGVVPLTAPSHDPFDAFWKPILSSHAPVLLCIGNVEGGRVSSEDNPNLSPTLSLKDFHNSPFETVNVHDANTMAKFTGLLGADGRQFEFKSQSDATFTDLQNGPTILVGLLNNNWTERLVPKLRFTVDQTADKVTIHDRDYPSKQEWSINYSTPYMDVTRDYARS